MKPSITSSRIRPGLLAVLMSAAMLGFPAAIEAATYSKANNAANLNLTTSWTGGVVPTNTDVGSGAVP
jgi:hypothetical protein